MASNSTTEELFGRTVLYSNAEIIDDTNVTKVLNAVLSDFQKNQKQIKYLYEYYKGKQPILEREKTFRPEINNKVVENHANEIVSFKVGYGFGEPVQYVRRATRSGTEFSNSDNTQIEDEKAIKDLTTLNEFMFNQDKASQDKDLAEWFFICGTAYRMVFPHEETEEDFEETPFEIDVADPQYTAVVYSSGFGHKPLMSIQQFEKVNPESNDPEDTTTAYSIYTPTNYYEITDEVITAKEINPIGMIPIIEYPANSVRMGAFELVIYLLDAINNSEANRMDGIEQFVQSFMKFINVNIDTDEYEEFLQKGAIKVRSEQGCPADVDIISSELNQSEVQIALNNLYQMVLTICGMPDRNGANRTTGDTGQAVMLRDGWSAAEAKAKDTELMFKKSERKFLKVVLKILREKSSLDMRLSDIDIKFTRNKTDNLLTKTQGLQSMLESGIHPQIALLNCGLFSDPEQVYSDSLPYLQKWEYKDTSETTENNEKTDDSDEKDDKGTKLVPEGVTPTNNQSAKEI